MGVPAFANRTLSFHLFTGFIFPVLNIEVASTATFFSLTMPVYSKGPQRLIDP